MFPHGFSYVTENLQVPGGQANVTLSWLFASSKVVEFLEEGHPSYPKYLSMCYKGNLTFFFYISFAFILHITVLSVNTYFTDNLLLKLFVLDDDLNCFLKIFLFF